MMVAMGVACTCMRVRGIKTCTSCASSTVCGPFENDIGPHSSPLPTGEGVVGHCRVGGGPQVLRCAATVLAQGASQHPEVSARPFPRRTGDAEAPLTVVEGWHLSRCRATPSVGSQADSGSRAWGPGGSPSHMAKADEVRPQPHGGRGSLAGGPGLVEWPGD